MIVVLHHCNSNEIRSMSVSPPAKLKKSKSFTTTICTIYRRHHYKLSYIISLFFSSFTYLGLFQNKNLRPPPSTLKFYLILIHLRHCHFVIFYHTPNESFFVPVLRFSWFPVSHIRQKLLIMITLFFFSTALFYFIFYNRYRCYCMKFNWNFFFE